MPDNIFLTDERREVLQGKDREITDQSLHNAKSRIRVRTRLALEELTEVAESPEIRNESVFDPESVHQLLIALLTPDQFTEIEEEPNRDFRNYRRDLYMQLGKAQSFAENTDDKL